MSDVCFFGAYDPQYPRNRILRAGPLDLLLRPPLRFLRMYVLQLGVLDGAHGLALCGLAAAGVYLKYAGLWARARDAGDA